VNAAIPKRIECGLHEMCITIPSEIKPSRQMLVASYHGLDEPSRLVVVDTLDAALSPLIQTLDVARAFAAEHSGIYWRATHRLRAIVEGREKPPSSHSAQLQRARWGRGFRRCLEGPSRRIAEHVIVNALLPLVATVEVARAVEYDDCLIFQVSRRIDWRLREAAKEARRG
jgi:hypothetical protein